MDRPNMHLAQFNIARLLAPIDDPKTKDFKDALDAINLLAEQSDGFVWRLKGDSATPGDPSLLTNLSVWTNVDALKHYVYRSGHVYYFKERKQWFAPMHESPYVLWWVPNGYTPTFAEAQDRLAHLHAHGETDHAFTFKRLINRD